MTDYDLEDYKFPEPLARADWSNIPDYMRGGLRRYFSHGIPPGSFLVALLSNDLKEACGRADDTNKHLLFDYVFFLYNHAPIGSWGSPHAFNQWITGGGLEGRKENA